jgi:hypothetical protein
MLTIKLFGIYIVMKIFVPIPFFSLLVSYDMGIWNKKTTLIKINNNEKGFIQVKETIQTSHQQWNIKKNTIFFLSGKSWFGLVNHLGSPDRMSCKKFYNFAFTENVVINKVFWLDDFWVWVWKSYSHFHYCKPGYFERLYYPCPLLLIRYWCSAVYG